MAAKRRKSTSARSRSSTGRTARRSGRGRRRAGGKKEDASSIVLNFLLLLLVVLSVSLGVLYSEYRRLHFLKKFDYGISEYAPWEKFHSRERRDRGTSKVRVFSKRKVASKKNSPRVRNEDFLRKENLSDSSSKKSSSSNHQRKSFTYIAIVLDDFGNENRLAEKFFRIDYPLTCAVLPRLRYSRWASENAVSHGKEVILHQPLEPYGYPKVNPGPGAILTDMSKDEVFGILDENFRSVPQAIGMNNHMGSKGTEDYFLMSAVMEYLKKRGMFFLDSRTSPDSLACSVASDFGVPCASRDVFLDNENDVSYVEKQLLKAVSVSRRKGYAVAIGHATRSSTAIVLEKYSGKWKQIGIRPVSLSFVIALAGSRKLSYRLLFGRFLRCSPA